MKNAKISRRSFLLGLAACSAAGVLTACKGTDAPSGSTASSAAEPPASSAASSTVQQPEPFLTEAEFPPLDGSTACIPLMAQMLADTTGMDLEEARSSITVSTTAYAWENFGLYDTTTRMLVVYEAPDYVKEELQKANVELEQKPIGVDALVFIVNEDNPVQALSSSCGISMPERSPTGRMWAARIRKSLPFSAARTPAARPCSKSCSFRAES